MSKKEETDEIKALRAFKERTNLSYDKLGKALNVHSITIFNWFRGHQAPSDMAKRIIIEFLKKNEEEK